MLPKIVTMTTGGYVAYTENLFRQFRKYGLRVHIYCLDHASLEHLASKNIPCQQLHHVIDLDEDRAQKIYGTETFKRTCVTKLDVIAKAFEHSDAVLWVDGDVVLRRDPTALLQEAMARLYDGNLDLLIQCDENHTGPCAGPERCWKCSGIMLLRKTRGMLAMAGEYASPDVWPEQWHGDQDYVNWFVGLSGAKCEIFPRSLVPNGVFVGAPPPETVMLHYNYLVGDEKMARMIANEDFLAGQ